VRTQVPLQLVEKKEDEEPDNKNTNKKSLKGMSDTADRSIKIKGKNKK
jgi:hypothetical protein